MNDVDDIIKKIKKILSIVDRSDKPGEVANAQSMAQELITKYQITEAELNASANEDIISREVKTPKPYSLDKIILLNAIAKANYCRVLKSRDNSYCYVYGTKTDVQLVIGLYNNLNLHMINAMKRKLKSVKHSSDNAHTRTWTKSFFGGYAVTITERMREARTRVMSSTVSSTDLVVYFRDKEHIIEDFWQRLDKLPGSKRQLDSSDGFASGRNSAYSADLDGQRLDGADDPELN